VQLLAYGRFDQAGPDDGPRFTLVRPALALPRGGGQRAIGFAIGVQMSSRGVADSRIAVIALSGTDSPR